MQWESPRTDADCTTANNHDVLCLFDLASPRIDVRARVVLRSGELDGIGPSGPSRKDERRVRYPLAVLENKFAALARSCFRNRDGLPNIDRAVAVVEELVEPEESLVLELIFARDGDARHGDEVNVEGAVVDEDKVVLRRAEDLRKPAYESSSGRAASNDYEVLLGDLLSHGSVSRTSEDAVEQPRQERGGSGVRGAGSVVGRHVGRLGFMETRK